MEKVNPYHILGVPADAADRQIRAAYFKLVRLHPPETQPERFKEIRSAYESLMSVQTRARADVSVIQPPDFVFELAAAAVPAFFDLPLYDRLFLVCQDLFQEGALADAAADYLGFEQAYGE